MLCCEGLNCNYIPKLGIHGSSMWVCVSVVPVSPSFKHLLQYHREYVCGLEGVSFARGLRRQASWRMGSFWKGQDQVPEASTGEMAPGWDWSVTTFHP